MKMLKIEKNSWFKWTVIVLVCYLFASYGVNGLINPSAYFVRGRQEEAAISNESGRVVVNLPEHIQKYKYLNINLKRIDIFETAVKIICRYDNDEFVEKEIQLCNRNNGFELQELGAEVKSIFFDKAALDEYAIVIDNVTLTETKQVDTLKMFEIWFSFVGVAAFYNFMQWIKKRYAK